MSHHSTFLNEKKNFHNTLKKILLNQKKKTDTPNVSCLENEKDLRVLKRQRLLQPSYPTLRSPKKNLNSSNQRLLQAPTPLG